MSEGSQAKNHRQPPQQHPNNNKSASANSSQAETISKTSATATVRAGQPQIGALLVEAYGKIVPKRTGFSAENVLLEYAKFLVSTSSTLLRYYTHCPLYRTSP